METIKKPAVSGPNYMKMAFQCFQLDCGTWYTQEAHISFAKFLEKHNMSEATFDDLLVWKKINHINS
jgi:hypothetical protein